MTLGIIAQAREIIITNLYVTEVSTQCINKSGLMDGNHDWMRRDGMAGGHTIYCRYYSYCNLACCC